MTANTLRQVHSDAQIWHATSPAFSTYLPASLLPSLAVILLSASFMLTFYISTLSRDKSLYRLALSLATSALAGVGVVSLFCSVGVYV